LRRSGAHLPPEGRRTGSSEALTVGRRQRALRQPAACRAVVVLGGRHVVRPIGVEDGRKPLDLAAPGAELELAAAVHLQAPLFTLLDALEQSAQSPEARRLDVEPARLDRQLADVLPGVDRG